MPIHASRVSSTAPRTGVKVMQAARHGSAGAPGIDTRMTRGYVRSTHMWFGHWSGHWKEAHGWP